MMTMSRNKMILLLTLITWCCNNLQVKSDLFIRSYNAHRTQFDAFVYNSLEDVNEEKPHLVTPCETVVNRSDDKSRYPKYVYHGRCKSLGGQCGQSTKKVHMLVPGNASALKSEYRDDFVPYTIEVVTINTTCVQRRPDKLLQTETKIHKFSEAVLKFFNRRTTDSDLEPIGEDRANSFAECQWDWVRHIDDNRIPRVFERAVCRDYERCKPVFKEIVMFAKRSDGICIGNYCNYEPKLYNETVACVLRVNLDTTAGATSQE